MGNSSNSPTSPQPKGNRHQWQQNKLQGAQYNAQASRGGGIQGPANASTGLIPINLGIPEFPTPPATAMMNLTERYTSSLPNTTSSTVQPDYLFHVIVALEWQPSKQTLTTLMHGLRGASDALYDATNGSMIFGQVTFCGPEYMAAADIQVMASNRFHPRSMVNGLNDESKFFPIRIGRGIWHKNNRMLRGWDEQIAYRAIAHEWAHYALSLHDLYIDYSRKVSRRGYRLIDDTQGVQTLVVPRVRLSIESLMATLEASEIVPLQSNRISQTLQATLLNEFTKLYNTIAIAKVLTPNPGPHRYPGDLPQFYHTADFKLTGGSSTEIQLDVNNINDANGDKLDHCWLYTLHYDNNELVRITTQGTIEARARDIVEGNYTLPGAGQLLLGANPTDQVLIIGSHKQAYTSMSGFLNTQGPASSAPTSAATPNLSQSPVQVTWTSSTITTPPVIAVLPSPNVGWPNIEVSVRIVDEPMATAAWIAVPGAPAKQITRAPISVDHLDGVIALTWQEYRQESGSGTTPQPYEKSGSDKAEQPDQETKSNQALQPFQERLWVAEYSHGGNPPTSVRDPTAPISAGSADGNLMIFCKDDTSTAADSAYQTRIVTTRNYGGFEKQNPGTPCSYLFSVASNRPIERERLNPTIVLYYDADVLKEGSDLFIFRYDEMKGCWQEVRTYLPPGDFYAAAAMDEDSAPNLTKLGIYADKRVEYYRLFAVPRW